MATADIINRRCELAHRIGGGLEVALYWNTGDNSTSIEVHHLESETHMRFAVPADQALDAFYHPLNHVRYSSAA
jgi:hypothetical protein